MTPLPAYTSVRNRKDFTAHQLFAVLALKTFFKTDYRGVAQLLTDLADLRNDLGLELEKVARDSPLCYAAVRLLKRGGRRPPPPRHHVRKGPRPDREDAEGHHRYARAELGVRATVIPLNPRG